MSKKLILLIVAAFAFSMVMMVGSPSTWAYPNPFAANLSPPVFATIDTNAVSNAPPAVAYTDSVALTSSRPIAENTDAVMPNLNGKPGTQASINQGDQEVSPATPKWLTSSAVSFSTDVQDRNVVDSKSYMVAMNTPAETHEMEVAYVTIGNMSADVDGCNRISIVRPGTIT